MKSIRRFTLVELLAVMALIAILSALGFGMYSYAKGKAKESSTEALLKQLDAGLGNFHTQFGYYPRSTSSGNAIQVNLAADRTVSSINFGADTLTGVASPSNKTQRMQNEQLEAFTKSVDLQAIKENHLDSQGYIVDAWGNRIQYRAPGQFKTGSYDLISAGADGVFGASKSSSPTGALSNYRKDNGEHVCDDVFNF